MGIVKTLLRERLTLWIRFPADRRVGIRLTHDDRAPILLEDGAWVEQPAVARVVTSF